MDRVSHVDGQGGDMPGLLSETAERRWRLRNVLKQPGTPWRHCHTAARLQSLFEDDYSGVAGRRKLQRDLRELIDSEVVEGHQETGNIWYYRRAKDDIYEDLLIRQRATASLVNLISDALRSGTLTDVWHRVLADSELGLLTRDQLLVIPDHLQLQQVRLSSDILSSVVSALIESHPVMARYQKRNGEAGDGKLHPQALLHRGPIPYLLAIKEGMPETIKHFPLHRMQSVKVLTDETRTRFPDFDLQEHIDRGHGDFGQGEHIELELRAKGYIAEILEACPLTAAQTIDVEPEGSSFEIRVRANLPSTGTLFRWLLAAGANVEVMAPEGLRARVGAQLNNGSRLYQTPTMSE